MVFIIAIDTLIFRCIYNKRKLVNDNAFPQPINNHDLEDFSGLVSYFRRLKQPFTDLLHKDAKISWRQEQSDLAFNEIKTLLRNIRSLHGSRNPYRTYMSGLGATLFQRQRKRDIICMCWSLLL